MTTDISILQDLRTTLAAKGFLLGNDEAEKEQQAISDAIQELQELRAELEMMRNAREDLHLRPSEATDRETGDGMVDRLRGIYTTPVNDGAGPLHGKTTFTRRFFTGKLMREAASRIENLQAAISQHHAQKADDRCIEDDAKLYAAAGLPPHDCRVGDKAAMLANCQRFIERRCQGGGWPSYAELEKTLDRFREALTWAVGFIECNVPTAREGYPDMRNASSLLREHGDKFHGEFQNWVVRAELAEDFAARLRTAVEELRASAESRIEAKSEPNDEDPDVRLWAKLREILETPRQTSELSQLRDWKASVLGAVQNIPEYETGTWAGDKTGWGIVFERINWLNRDYRKVRAALEKISTSFVGPPNRLLYQPDVGKLLDKIHEICQEALKS